MFNFFKRKPLSYQDIAKIVSAYEDLGWEVIQEIWDTNYQNKGVMVKITTFRNGQKFISANDKGHINNTQHDSK